MRQTYGLTLQRMTAEWFHEKNQRTYGLVRGSNAGASALPYVLPTITTVIRISSLRPHQQQLYRSVMDSGSTGIGFGGRVAAPNAIGMLFADGHAECLVQRGPNHGPFRKWKESSCSCPFTDATPALSLYRLCPLSKRRHPPFRASHATEDGYDALSKLDATLAIRYQYMMGESLWLLRCLPATAPDRSRYLPGNGLTSTPALMLVMANGLQ